MNSRPLPYQGSALPLSYNGLSIKLTVDHCKLTVRALSQLSAIICHLIYGAEDEVRTRDLQLGRLSLYQLSYFRITCLLSLLSEDSSDKERSVPRSYLRFADLPDRSQIVLVNHKDLWARMDSNHRTPKRTDLQSVAVGHLATCPSFKFSEPVEGFEPPTS